MRFGEWKVALLAAFEDNMRLFHSLEREFVVQEDFMKAVRKVADNKKLESKLDYKPV